MLNINADAESADSSCHKLYKIGGTAALFMAGITLTQFIVFTVEPPPLEGNASDWFALFQKSALLGLLGFESLLIIYAILAILVAVVLFVALKSTNQSLTTLFLILSAIGGMAFIVARPAFEMLSLSNQYSVATTDAQRAVFVAAGESMVAVFHGTAFQVSYILGSITGFLIATVMLQSAVFSRSTAYLRMASSLLDFGIYMPGIGLYLSLFSVVFLMIFNIMVARRLFQLSSGRSQEKPITRLLANK